MGLAIDAVIERGDLELKGEIERGSHLNQEN
jgi:hypothetical protein